MSTDSGSRLRVLIAEDDWLLAAQMETWLTEEGHEVVGVAASCSAAIALAERTRPDFAVVDFNLCGEMAGPMIARLRKTSTKVIVVSGYHNPCDIGDNVVAVFQKPAIRPWIMKALRQNSG